ncbi:hypothetical protein [Aquibium microcysteis]|uniref:hypothetical protein n=1 Tax=Aquibium microcysteis TaxID=675281 RepID=UPI00165D1E8A|nr:hypothetical protein [Aquibium microcysteis]
MNHPVRSKPLIAHRRVAPRREIAGQPGRRPDAAGTGMVAIRRPAEAGKAPSIALPAFPRAVADDPRCADFRS